MLKKWGMAAVLGILAGFALVNPVQAADPAKAFRQQNGLVAYSPPPWFLAGDFIAREKNPRYVFGKVRDFAKALRCPTAWLIEDLELKRIEPVLKSGRTPEYSLYLEAARPGGTVYWMFVVFPHKTAQEWFLERRRFHGRKAKDYYGKTEKELQRALDAGLAITGELRFFITKGQISMEVPEEVLTRQIKFAPVWDLSAGRRLPAAKGTR